MNRRAVHSCTVTRECLSETKKPALEPYPRGSSNQLIRPVRLSKKNKKKDITFTIHILDSFPVISMIPLFQKGSRRLSDNYPPLPRREGTKGRGKQKGLRT
jgi:hypothetical protein